MGIECECEPTFAYWTWRLRLVLMLAWGLVHLLRGIRVFGFRRAPLKTKHRREHIGRHLQKFALPVFKHRSPKMAAHDIGRVAEGGLPMRLLVVAVRGIPGETVPEQAQPKQTEHHQAETIIPQYFAHRCFSCCVALSCCGRRLRACLYHARCNPC